MDRMNRLNGMQCLLTIVMCLFLRAPAIGQPSERPNILWIVSEDNGPFLGCYGDSFATTPHLDQLASEGILFEQAFSNAPVCAPSRSTLITGVYASSMGTEGMRSGYPVPELIRLFPAYLRELGYYATNNAKTDYNLSPTEVRMSEAWDESSGKASYKNRKPGQPFFAIYNSGISHESSIHKLADTLLHDPQRVPMPDYHPRTPEMEHDWAQYYDKVTQMNAWVGQVLNELERSGEAENTIVFYYSDHGGVLGRSKRFLYESGLRVPLIIRCPEKYAHLVPYGPNTRVRSVVSFIDFAPTVLRLAGASIPKYMEGRPFLGERAAQRNEYAFGFRGRMDEQIDMSRTVRDAKYRYIRNYMPHKIYGRYLDYMWRAPSMQSWKTAYQSGSLNAYQSAFWQPKPYEELYDCDSDPDNIRNLATDVAHLAVLDRLRAALDLQMIEGKDVGLIPEPIMADIADSTTLYEFGQHEYARARVFETATLAASKIPSALDTLIVRLQDRNSVVRYWAAIGCRIREAAAISAKSRLIGLLTDPVVAVRIAAAEALYFQGEKEQVLDVLIQALDNDNRMARVQALNVLETLGEDGKPALAAIRRLARPKPSGLDYDIRAARGYLKNLN